MPVACHFQCGETASLWNWNGSSPTEEVTVYTCPQCGIYGVTERGESCFRGPEDRHQAIEKEFLKMRPELLKRRPEEGAAGTNRVGIFSMRPGESGLELNFVTPKT